MRIANAARAVAVATLIAGVTLTAAPASAAVSVSFQGAQAQYDNNPGNNAESWVWVYAANWAAARVEYRHYDGTGGSLSTTSSASRTLNKDIWQIRVCVDSWSVGPAGCSDWS